MTLGMIVARFGYLGLIFGLILEGETALVLGAFMAHRGYMDLPLVLLTGLIVGFASDQFFFWLGRTKGKEFLGKRPAWMPSVEKADMLLGRNTTLLFLGIRFVYGLRIVLPFVIGMHKVDPKRFVFLNFIGSLLWVALFGIAGYLFGHVMELMFEDLKRHELWIALAIILIGTAATLKSIHQSKQNEQE
jgi:membrane protein DedA with SNARE-associated domain